LAPADALGNPIRIKREDFTVKILGPTEVTTTIYDNEDGTFDIEWAPKQVGKYTIITEASGKPLFSPLILNITAHPTDMMELSKSFLEGPGLERPIVGEETVFTLYTKEPNLQVEDICVNFAGPKIPEVHVFDNGDTSFDVEFELQEEGHYYVTIIISGKLIQGCPYHVITAGAKPLEPPNGGKVETLSSLGNTKPSATTTERRASRARAGSAKQQLATQNGPANPKKPLLQRYIEEEVAELILKAKEDELSATDVEESLNEQQKSDLKMERKVLSLDGPGLNVPSVGREVGIFLDTSGNITIEDVDVKIVGLESPPVNIFNNEDGTFDISYTLLQEGIYDIHVKVWGNPVKGSPFRVTSAGFNQKEYLEKQGAEEKERKEREEKLRRDQEEIEIRERERLRIAQEQKILMEEKERRETEERERNEREERERKEREEKAIKEKMDRERKELEDQIKRDKMERDRIDRERIELEEKAKRVDMERKELEEKVKRDKMERERIDKERKELEQKAKKRENGSGKKRIRRKG